MVKGLEAKDFYQIYCRGKNSFDLSLTNPQRHKKRDLSNGFFSKSSLVVPVIFCKIFKDSPEA